MPIISFGAAGAGAYIRFLASESMGGLGDIGPKIDAEVARTGLSNDEIGPKVHIPYHVSRRTHLVSKDILPYRRETHSYSWPS